MSRKYHTRRKGRAGRLLESNASVPSSATTTHKAGVPAGEQVIPGHEKDARLRDEAADRRERSAGLRDEATSMRDEAADLREQVTLSRAEGASLRDQVADLRDEVAHNRDESANLRDEAAFSRDQGASLRDEVAMLREQSLYAKEEDARSKAALSAQSDEQLREANEHLVLATIRSQSMAEAAEKATAQMSHMAEHDFLTGLPNRALLVDRLAQAIMLAQRHGRKVGLMFMDLDRFKHVNDSLGHAVGDQLLQSIAKRLQRCVRSSDTVSRQGGDEFVVLLAEVEEVQDAILIAEKLSEAMAQPHLIDGHRLHVTLSIGISLYPDDGKDVETLLKNADIAMYQAKKKGRNDYQVFTPDMNARAEARQSIEQMLRHALEHSEFILHYQPKVDLATGTITGVEALIRMHSDRQLVCPEQFISHAEDCGLILPIGSWALREACRQTQAWLLAGLELGQIAVNVSAKEFHSKGFLAGVCTILKDTGLDPRHLELEMTESSLMQETEPTLAVLHALKDIGVRIAIDDFGTGYSSLSYLQLFPIDTLKIDQSFVQHINGHANEAGEAIVRAVIAMGMSLKQRVVAEGIETRQQLAFLQSNSCAEGQGFFFSRPVTADEFATLLVNNRH